MLVSCDLLTTRNPEPPNTIAKNNIPATNPDSLFKNFKFSIEDKILENYFGQIENRYAGIIGTLREGRTTDGGRSRDSACFTRGYSA